jgi:TonB-dependent starch-binding outer membrane protein SusC
MRRRHRAAPSARALRAPHHGLLVCLLVIGSILSSTVPAWAQAARGREVTGTILDVDGSPVAGATVSVAGGPAALTATTGPDGAFRLAGVPTTNVVLDVTAEGFEPRQVTIIGARTALQLQLVLVRPAPPAPPPDETRIVSGVVLDAATREPLAGARVRVQGTELQTLSERDGTFTLIGVPAGDVVLAVEAAGQPAMSMAVPAAKGAVVVTLGAPPVDEPPPLRIVRGVVVETASGEAVPGAAITLPGTNLTAISDVDGSFALEGAPEGALTLEVVAGGYETRSVTIGPDQDTLGISLAFAEGELIIVEGRAPVIVKQNLASGASVVQSGELNRVSAQTVEGALQGKLAGANLQFNSGAPGGGAQLRLRGISTINGQSSPLFVIDGVVISNVAIPSGANAVTGAAAGGSASNQDNPVNRIADLNPNDIETVEVLKGASAAALYGSKAANGVVIITTKRGRSGHNVVNVTQRVGFSQVANKLGSRRFGSLGEVMETYGATSPHVQAYNESGGAFFDHEDQLTRTPLATETIASASGGTENGNYYGSVLVKDEPGVLIGTFYQKQTGRLALGYKLWDRLRLGVTTNVIHSSSDRGLSNNDNTGTSTYMVLSGTPSFVDLRPDNGVYPVNPTVGSGTNPLQTVQLLQNREDVWRLIAGSNANLDVYKDPSSTVNLLANFGADAFNQKNNLLSPPELIFEPRTNGLPGTSIDATATNFNYNVGTGALWAYKPRGGKWRSALSGGLTFESVDLSSVHVIARDLTAGQPNVDSGTAVQLTHTRLRTKDTGLYLQEEVALLDERLSLLAGLLGERSSLNGDTARYFIYPKLAAVYELGLAKDQFDLIRARAAYGQAGNRPNYGQKFTALRATTNIDGNAGLTVIGNAGDPGIEPERQQELEVGVDAAIKDQRAVVELTLYNRSISNLLLQRALPTSTGFTTQFFNGGSMRNRGVELALQGTPVVGTVEWTTRAILTLNRSQITDLPDGVDAFNITAAGFGAGLGAYRIEEGKSATQIVTTDGMGGFRPLGDGEPDFRVGFANQVRWRELTFSALVDWQQGSHVINLTRLLYDFGATAPDVEASAARLQSFREGDISPYVEDATFLKLREVSISYDVPEATASRLGPLRTLQISVSGRNLYTATGYSGLDPEVSNFGNQPIGRNYDVAPYPPSRSFWLSVSAGL